MNSFFLLRPALHALPPEKTHAIGIWALKNNLLPPVKMTVSPVLSQNLFGLSFSHPVGLAAGFDKNAEAISSLHAQGFSFVEAGTVTPEPQSGNSLPRMFRLPKDKAVINRLGFNNAGLDSFIQHFSARQATGIAGANIGKNKQVEDAIGDYIKGLEAVYPYADYITINVSSPNTQGLRALQKREQLTQLLTGLNASKISLVTRYKKTVPLLLKIAPDLDETDLEDIAEVALAQQIDGLIVSNTTIRRPRTLKSGTHGEQGGLSGAPLFALSTEVLSKIYKLVGGKIPLIGVGGISSAEEAYKKIRAGASLVQLYTALVYQGFGVVKEIVEGLPPLLLRDGFSHISEAIGADHH